MIDIQEAEVGFRFLVRWLLLTVVGYAVGFLNGFVLGHFLLGNIMVGVGIGTGVGLMQLLAIRRFVRRPGSWVLANAAALSLLLGLYAGVSLLWGYPFDLSWPAGALGWMLALATSGTLSGLLQSRLLQLHKGGSSLWVAANAVGWGFSVLGLAIPADMSGGHSHIAVLILRNGLLAPAVGGAILAAVTGPALVWILRQQAFQQSTEKSPITPGL